MRKSQFGQEQKGMGLQRAKSGMRVSKDFRKLAVSELRKVKQIKYDDRRPNGLVADLSLDHSILHRCEVWRVYHKHHTHRSALGQLTTAEFWTGGDFRPGRSRAVISREYWSKIGDPSKLARTA